MTRREAQSGTQSDVQMIRCPGCGVTNRVPTERVSRGEAPVCGRCQTPLSAVSSGAPGPIAVTDASFAADVEQSGLPVLMDAWAPWCGPCHMIAPVIDGFAREMNGRVRVVKLNVDENPRVAARFSLRSIPTLLVLEGGREIDRIVGVVPKQEITRRLARALAGRQ